jgi:hypothetical protein
MRVVVDTNNFISALVLPGSLAGKAVSRIVEGRDELVISTDIIKEVLSGLSWKFDRDREALSHVALIFSDVGEIVNPDKRIRVLKDEPDNRIPECAVFGIADLIVTDDKEMLRLKEYMGIRITSLRDYLGS